MNPYFKAEFSEYLEAAGYQRSEFTTRSRIQFQKDDRVVVIFNDHVDIMILTEEEPHERHACLSKYMSFSGLSQLDMFKWILLMHVTNVVPLKHLLAAAKKDSGRLPDILEEIIERHFGHFGIPADQHY